jgi:hypothetical protein
MSQMSYNGCGSVAEISCNVTGPSPAMLAAVGERVTMWRRGAWSSVGDDIHWMHGWLVVGPRCIAVAAVDVVAGLCDTRQRTVPRRVVPGPRGIVAGQSGMVFCWAM